MWCCNRINLSRRSDICPPTRGQRSTIAPLTCMGAPYSSMRGLSSKKYKFNCGMNSRKWSTIILPIWFSIIHVLSYASMEKNTTIVEQNDSRTNKHETAVLSSWPGQQVIDSKEIISDLSPTNEIPYNYPSAPRLTIIVVTLSLSAILCGLVSIPRYRLSYWDRRIVNIVVGSNNTRNCCEFTCLLCECVLTWYC